MLIFNCEECGAQLKLKDESAGKKVRCPSCRVALTAPVETTAMTSFPRGKRRRADEDDIPRLEAGRRDDDDATHKAAHTSGKALASLLLSIGNLLCLPFLLSVPGFILGIIAIVNINRSRGKLTGMWMAITGIVFSVLGDIAYAILGLFAIFIGGPILAFFVMILTFLGMMEQAQKNMIERQRNMDVVQFDQNFDKNFDKKAQEMLARDRAKLKDLAKDIGKDLAKDFAKDIPKDLFKDLGKDLPDLGKGIKNAANKAATVNNLKQVTLGMHSYHDMNNRMPPAPGMDLKNPDQLKLSWRVALLPFMEQPVLFSQFDQQQAWNAGKNKALLGKRPGTYGTALLDSPDPDATFVQVCTGPNTLFPNTKTVVNIAQIPDGTSNTIFAVQATAGAVKWTQPADILMTVPGQPLPAGLQAGPNQGFVISMCDGSARFINRARVSDQVLRLLIDPKDGQKLPPGWDAE